MMVIKTDIQLSPHFKLSEFMCKDGSNEVLVTYKLVDLLEKIRAHFGGKTLVITPNGGYRTEKWNIHCKGIPGSEHTKGTAGDIQIYGVTPTDIGLAADEVGALGVGVYPSFTHTDVAGDGKGHKLYWVVDRNERKTVVHTLPEFKAALKKAGYLK